IGIYSGYTGSSSTTTKGTDTVVFVKADTPPENAVSMPEGADIPDGFYPVKVVTGLSDTFQVEIKEGLNEGDEVFLQYMVDNSYGY
ncbi:MAG TPA: hypothetical protein PK597_02615, partial [Oscillospiraceae bacterium]|nr:hypothetical protein [Oscillospiraceae bacterium]